MLASVAAAGLGLASSSDAGSGEQHRAWFLQDYETRQWCAFIDESGARAAANSDRFDPEESGSLAYGDGAPKVMVTLQSQDAFVEDSYSFAPDLSVLQIVRRGRYINDPLITATYRPDAAGRLRMTAESARAIESWDHETYFIEWPMHRSFAELPFAALIETRPRVSVSANC